MLQRETTIERVRSLRYLDVPLVAATAYDSFARSEGGERVDARVQDTL